LFWWIQKLILEYISKFGSTVELPSNKINGVNRLDKRVRELEQKFGRAVDIEEIISEFGSGDTDGDNYSQLD
jgi:DNA-directed RNA polymerase sigma subunit (sigma70/sigma32)